jgi:DNA-binding NtrC family response regulator
MGRADNNELAVNRLMTSLIPHSFRAGQGSRWVTNQALSSAAMVKKMVENDLRHGDFSNLETRVERIQELVSRHLLEPEFERGLLLLAAKFLEGAGQTRRARRVIGTLLAGKDTLRGKSYWDLRRFRARLALNGGDLASARWEVDRIECDITETSEGFGLVKEVVDRSDLSLVTTSTWLLSAEVSLAETKLNEALQSLANALRCMQSGVKTGDEAATFELLSALVCAALGDDAGIPALAYLYRVHVGDLDESTVAAGVRARIAAAAGDMDRTAGISDAEAGRWRSYGPDAALVRRFLAEDVPLAIPADLLNRLPLTQAFQEPVVRVGEVAHERRDAGSSPDDRCSKLPMSFLFAAHALEEVATHFDYNLKTGPLVIDWSGCEPELIAEAIAGGAISEAARFCQRGTIYFNNGAYADACFDGDISSLGEIPAVEVIFELFRISMAGLPGACGRQYFAGPAAARIPEVISLRPNKVNIDLMRRLDHMRSGGRLSDLDESEIDSALASWPSAADAASSNGNRHVSPSLRLSEVNVNRVGVSDAEAGKNVSFLKSLLGVTEANSVPALHESLRACLAGLGLETAIVDITLNESGQSLLDLMPAAAAYELWGKCKAGSLTVSVSFAKGLVVDCSESVQLVLNVAAQRLRTMSGQSLNHRVEMSGFVAEDLVTQALLSTLRDFALLDGSNHRLKHLLLTGERGVGKELLAKAIHSWSGRCGNIFRAVNFGAISKDLAAAEVFGAKKGAYTGADRDRRGYIQEADGGTLFLDELDEAGDTVQALLKRVVQFGTFNAVGSPDELQADVRFVAATNVVGPESTIKRDLRDRFLEVRVPPLRERRGDIRPMAEMFAAQCGYLLPDAVLAFLERLTWPGNVRQLQNVVERSCAVVKSGDDLTLDLFQRSADEEGASIAVAEIGGAKFRPLEKGETLKTRRQKEDELHIRYALEFCKGNRKHAAEFLGMTRQGLTDRMRELAISDSR